MSTTTSKLGLYKPDLSDVADITKLNENWDKIDVELKNLNDKIGEINAFLDVINGEEV